MKGESIIYFAKEWGEDRTSCDQVFDQLARDNRIVWVNSIASRTPNLGSGHDWRRVFHKLRKCMGGLKQVGPTSWVYQPIVVPLPYSSIARGINRCLLRWSIRRIANGLGMKRPQVWTFLPNSAYLLGLFDESLAVYYCTDAWSGFSFVQKEKMAVMERQLLEKADLCFTTAQSLAERARKHNRNTFVASHGVEHAHFASALNGKAVIPDDVARFPWPIVGFFGMIDNDWIDLALIRLVAERHPEWSVVLIGKSRVDLGELKRLPNVHVLGRRPYNELPSYCKAFGVGLIPFAVNELTHHASPIKLREYLSAGLPVVSTHLPEVEHYKQFAAVARSHDEFIVAVEQALREDSPARRRERSESMRDETWESKVRQLGEIAMRTKAARAMSSHVIG